MNEETGGESSWRPHWGSDEATVPAEAARPAPEAWAVPGWRTDGASDTTSRYGAPIVMAGHAREKRRDEEGSPRRRRDLLPLVVVASMLLGGLAGGVAGFTAGRLASTPAAGGVAGVPARSGAVVHEVTVVKDVSTRAAEVVKAVGPAVVTVINTQVVQDVFGNQSQQVSTGSGVIIDKEGDIITNYHVVAGYSKLEVSFADANGNQVPATLVGSDVDNDLAVIKVNARVPGWAPLGDSTQLQPGDTVLAIGSALGDFHNTVTEGIVSALNRQITETADDGSTHTLNDMIQTDAAINHGNSGGPLIDLNGYVVGINTAIVRSSSGSGSSPFDTIPGLGSVDTGDQAQGLGFAIASRTVKSVAQRLLLRLPIAYLGVKAPTLTPQLASYLGVSIGAYVQVVEPGSPAAQAGLEPRDVILKVDGRAIDEAHSLTNLVRLHKPGDVVVLTVNRGGRTLTLKVTLGALPASLG
jgi:2-alkenal reductase